MPGLTSKCFTLLVFTLFYHAVIAQKISIIPQPEAVVEKKGSFVLDDKVTLFYNGPQLQHLADYAVAAVKTLNGVVVQASAGVSKTSKTKNIRLVIDTASATGTEGYSLEVSSTEISIKSKTGAGLLYGVQTLLQLIPADGGKQVPCVLIQDKPRFGWRGLMLDVSRHFFTMAEIKRLVDEMVQYKFNRLHLHLTDDQGWRIEIKSLPELTKTGAWSVPRTGLWWDRQPPKQGEAATYGGFYTQEELKDLVKYAKEKNIDIVPEIDIPGHSLAAIAAYPYLSCTKKIYQVNPGSKFYTIDDDALCPGQDSTFEFLNKVFTEVAEIFPFEYIHVGGDEAFKGFWEKCDSCKRRIKDNHLANTEELQSYFIRRIEVMLKPKGKKLLGWDEILEGGLAPEATVMSWRGMSGGIAAAKAKHHVIMSPTHHAYLDLYQGDPAIEPPTYSKLRLQDVYAFEPVPKDVDAQYILGGQANLWTESVPTFHHAEYMFWPRSLAMAEVLWTPAANRNWNNFIARTEQHFKRFDKAGINYARSMYDAIILPSKNEKDSLQIQLDTELEGLDLYYTFDNTYPDKYTPKYTKGDKLQIPTDAETFRVITYKDGSPAGRMIVVSLDDLLKRIPKGK